MATPPPPQARCRGLLLYRQAGGALELPASARCWGVTDTVHAAGEIDLHTHHSSRDVPAAAHAAALTEFGCLGSAVFQSGPAEGAQAPPPFCLGVEFLRYAQGVAEATAAGAHHHDAHARGAGAAAYARQSAAADAAGGVAPLAQQRVQQQQPRGAGAGAAEQELPRERPGVLGRLAELGERLEGADPLWFGKAFAHRASLNLASMRRMAGEMAAAATGGDVSSWEEHDETE
ncbi:hypothetical protein HT031_000807 [Scenedesmus sp. PABB004]|nr:hypothetical protein HT031_000807 [Scenedesmus sp. PABB004]